MIKFVMLLVYLLTNGELKIEKKEFDTKQECQTAGQQRMEKILQLNEFDEGVLSVCIETKAVKA